MLDRTIPFYNTILKCAQYDPRPETLPEGYRILSYQPGFELDWTRLECETGDFEDEKEALHYFRNKYLTSVCRDDVLFLLESSGKVIGSCAAWTDDRNGTPVNSLHWLVVDEAYQGRLLGRLLCVAVMNRFFLKGGGPIYIHTQPWSWKAILLYVSLGFRLQKTDSFGTYTNQYGASMSTLKQILSEEQVRYLEERSDE